jgi:hypothetical protein
LRRNRRELQTLCTTAKSRSAASSH